MWLYLIHIASVLKLKESICRHVVQEDNYKLSARKLHLTSLPSSPFDLEIVTEIEPQNNTSLEGLYKSTGNFCTQCEAEGFRKITYFQVWQIFISVSLMLKIYA